MHKDSRLNTKLSSNAALLSPIPAAEVVKEEEEENLPKEKENLPKDKENLRLRLEGEDVNLH